MGILLTVCFVAMLSTNVYAGDINSAEQMIINYYNGTFTYEGKTYVATEAAKATAYNKLIADDVDLTAAQAKTAIRNASNQVKEGIDQGHLVEVSQTPSTENPSTQNPGTEVPSTEGTEAVPPSTEDGSNPGNGDGSAGEVTTPGNPGDNEPDGESGDGSSGDGESEGDIVKPTEKVDVDSLVGDALEAGDGYSKVQVGTAGESASGQPEDGMQMSLTVEQYIDGELTAVTDDGALLFKGGLPIKNTGYHTGGLKNVLTGMCVVFGLTLIAGISCVIRGKKQ